MKRTELAISAVLMFSLAVTAQRVLAEDAAAPADPSAKASPSAAGSTQPTPSIAAPAATEPVKTTATTATTIAATAPASTPAVSTESAAAENLEFVSGEVTAVDESAKSVTVKLYGETENAAPEKTLTVKLDANTDITDGEKDRDIKSLTKGTEVDVEYDPASSKATYIFVY